MIPPWLNDLIQYAPWIVPVVMLIILISWALSKGLPWIRGFIHFIDDVTGAPARPGVKARPGLMERVGKIEHELMTNGGGSLKDGFNRMESAIADLKEKSDETREIVGETADNIHDLAKWQESHQKVTDDTLARIHHLETKK